MTEDDAPDLRDAGGPDAGCRGSDGDCQDLPDAKVHPVHLRMKNKLIMKTELVQTCEMNIAATAS